MDGTLLEFWTFYNEMDLDEVNTKDRNQGTMQIVKELFKQREV